MVDLIRPTMGPISFKDDYKRPHSVHLSLQIVILDKTNPSMVPRLYQLNDPSPHASSEQAFTLLGDVVEINTYKKIITLTDNNIVSYDHMLIATSAKNGWMNPLPNLEFAAGVHILMEALKLQNSRPPQPQEPKRLKINSSKGFRKTKLSLLKPKAQKQSSFVANDSKRVYQLQL